MKFRILVFMISLLLFSCKKPDEDGPKESKVDTLLTRHIKGIYVMNEGTWQQNNASLTYFNYSTNTVTNDFFSATAGRKLGDVANDLLLVNSTLFILVNNSNTLEKVAIKTGEVTQLRLVNFQNVGRQPRQFFLHTNGDLFITSFDDVVSVIDTASLTVKQLIRVGRDPEGLAVIGNKLFVANSGGLDFPNYDSTVSVIDVTNYSTLATLNVGLNPGGVAIDRYGKLYVSCSGNHGDIPSSIHIIDTESHETELVWNQSASAIQIVGDTIFMLNRTTKSVDFFDTKTHHLIRSGVVDASKISTISAFHVDPVSQLIFMADGLNYLSSGVVYAFDYEGSERFHFDAGVIPSKIAVEY